MKQIFQKPYLYWLLGIFGIYLLVNILISNFYVTLKFLPMYTSSLNWVEFIVSIILTLVIASLVSINTVFGYIIWKKYNVAKESAMLCVGSIGGLAAGVCPACVTSVFPLIFGLFGVSFSWISLPLRGFEIQILVIVVLGLNLYLLTRKKQKRRE